MMAGPFTTIASLRQHDDNHGSVSDKPASAVAFSAQATIAAGGHAPVMLREVLKTLDVHEGATLLDGTFGGGGYARALLAVPDTTLWAIDRDPDAIARGEALSGEIGSQRLHMLHGTFGDMAQLAKDAPPFDGIVLDLGVSSFQLDQSERGFSFRNDGPLDMRMGQSGASAEHLVNTAPEGELADIIFHYGEDRLARRIARAIVAARAEAQIRTTGQLAEVIRRVVPKDRSGIDPATRAFQGLRIAVNDELGEIERMLEAAPGMLAPGGRLVIVSFHSLEDRLVKRAMASLTGRAARPSRHEPLSVTQQDTPPFSLLTPRPVRAASDETDINPRARSARLRALARLAPSPSGPTR